MLLSGRPLNLCHQGSPNTSSGWQRQRVSDTIFIIIRELQTICTYRCLPLSPWPTPESILCHHRQCCRGCLFIPWLWCTLHRYIQHTDAVGLAHITRWCGKCDIGAPLFASWVYVTWKWVRSEHTMMSFAIPSNFMNYSSNIICLINYYWPQVMLRKRNSRMGH